MHIYFKCNIVAFSDLWNFILFKSDFLKRRISILATFLKEEFLYLKNELATLSYEMIIKFKI